MAGATLFISQYALEQGVEIQCGYDAFIVELDSWWSEIWHDYGVVLRANNDNFYRSLGG